MAQLKKNQLNQVMFVLVDATDFATVESAITASQMVVKIGNASATAKFYGVNHGTSTAFTSGTISKVATLVHSGIWCQTLEAAECNYDFITYRWSYPGCADQIMAFQMLTYDDTDTYSMASNYLSNISNYLSHASNIRSGMSDILSKVYAHTTGASDILSKVYVLDASIASDVISMLSTVSQLRVRANYSTVSDMASKIASHVWGVNITAASMASNIASQIWAHADGASAIARISQIDAMLSDFYSDFTSKVPKAPATASALSNYHSDIVSVLDSQFVVTSNLNSYMSATLSDFVSNMESRIPKAVATASVLSDFYSDFGSRVPKEVATKSLLSDVNSNLLSLLTVTGISLTSDVMSNIRSAVAAGPAATITDADVSNIVSAVWYRTGGSDATSKLGKLASRITAPVATSAYLSDVLSAISDMISDMNSQLSALTSNVYSLASDVYSAMAVTATTSDIASAVWSQKWDVHSTASTFGSAMAKWAEFGISLNSDTMSNLRSAITAGPAATVTDADISNITSAVWYRTGGSDITSKIGKLSSRITKPVATASILSDFYSDFGSRVPKAVATASVLSDFYSDFVSKVPKAPATASALSDYYSDIISTLGSQFAIASDFYSDMVSKIPKAPATASTLSDMWSDILSRVGTTGVVLTSDALSNIQSVLFPALTASDFTSKFGKLMSRVTAPVATQSKLGAVENVASDILSNVSSGFAVQSNYASYLSTLLSDFVSDMQSRVPKEVASKSLLSDINSNLLSLLTITGVSLTSDVMSNLRSAVAAGPAATITDADISNITSAVWFRTGGSDATSKLGELISRITKPVATASMLSDFYSDFVSKVPKAVATASILSDFYSEFGSRVTKKVATDSQLSNAWSDIRSLTSGITATVDSASVASAVWANAIASDTVSKVGKLSSRITKPVATASMLSDTLSQLTSMVPSLLATQSYLSNVISDLKSAVSNVESAMDSQYTKVYSAVQAGGLTSDAMSDIAVAVWGLHYNSNSTASSFGSLFEKIASGVSDAQSVLDSQFVVYSNILSDIGSQLDAQDDSFVDATVLTENTLKDRIRRMNWVLQNKLAIDDVSGDAVLYKDDNATAAYTVTGAVTDTGVTTTRKRLE